VVDFWAQWCHPCRALAPILTPIAEEITSNAMIAKVDVNEYPELSERLGAQSIPTIILFQR
jgi:thioredoxin